MNPGDQIERNIGNYKEQMLRKLRESAKIAIRKAGADMFAYLETEISEMFHDVIEEYYRDYSPEFYIRNESLYDILRIIRDPNPERPAMWINLSTDNMTGYRSGYQGDDGLYDTVFRKGWHGGAAHDGKKGLHPDDGTPYYRTPYPYRPTAETGFWHWGHEAERMDPSPLELFKQRLTEAARGRFAEEYQRLITKYTNEINIK